MQLKKIAVIFGVPSAMMGFVYAIYPKQLGDIIDNFLSQYFQVSPTTASYLAVAIILTIMIVWFIGWALWEGLIRIPFGQRFRDKTKEFFHAKADWGALDPKFGHLTIHYASKKDTPCTKKPTFGRYVSNNKTMQAYWISTFVDTNRKSMNYHTHDGAEAVIKYLTDNHYTIHTQDPTLQELGLQVTQQKSDLNSIIERLTNFIYEPIPDTIGESYYSNFRTTYHSLMTETRGFIGDEKVSNKTLTLNYDDTTLDALRNYIELAKGFATQILNELKKYRENL